MWLVDGLSPFGFKRTGEDEEEKMEKSMVKSWHGALLALFDRDIEPPRAWSTRFIVVGTFFFLLFMLIAYDASLTSFEIAFSTLTTLSSFSDVQRTGASFATIANSSLASWITRNPSYSVRLAAKQMVLTASLSDAVEMLRDGQVSAVVAEDIVLRYYLAQPPCDLQLATGTESLDFNGFAVPRSAVNSRLHTVLSSGVSAALEGDILDMSFSRFYSFAVRWIGAALPAGAAIVRALSPTRSSSRPLDTVAPCTNPFAGLVYS